MIDGFQVSVALRDAFMMVNGKKHTINVIKRNLSLCQDKLYPHNLLISLSDSCISRASFIE